MLLGDLPYGRLTSERKASPSDRHSSITRPCCSSAQAPSSLSFYALEHSTGSERVDALGRHAVEVMICMITRDLSVISIDVTGVSLSLSLLLTKVTDAQYRKRFRASYNTAQKEHPLSKSQTSLFRTRQHHTTQESGGVWFFIAATPKHQIVVSHRSDIVQNRIKVISR